MAKKQTPDPAVLEQRRIDRELRRLAERITVQQARLDVLLNTRLELYEAGLTAGMTYSELGRAAGVTRVAATQAVDRYRKARASA